MTSRMEANAEGHDLRCPFLTELAALTCQLSNHPKLIPGAAIALRDQRCSSPGWVSCELARQRGPGPWGANAATGSTAAASCPFLVSSRVQCCQAAPVAKLIPRSDDMACRCNGDAHRFCELFLERAHPHAEREAAQAGGAADGATAVLIPPGICCAPNHMWLDVGADGSCHVGVDAFLSRVVGPVDAVTFLSGRGPSTPSVVLTIVGAELPLAFPQPIDVTGVNAALRTHPGALTSDPYRRGWLFEGTVLDRGRAHGAIDLTVGLLSGSSAQAWMQAEVERLSRHVHGLLAERMGDLGPAMADGGVVAEGLARHLDRSELLQVLSLFFMAPPPAGT